MSDCERADSDATERTQLLATKAAEDEPRHQLSGARFGALVACLLHVGAKRRPARSLIRRRLASGIASLDSSIVVTLASPIASAFGHAELYTSLGASFLGAMCAFTPLFGRYSDLFGRRSVISLAAALFIAGTALCGLAQTFGQLLLGRIISGAAAGGLGSMARRLSAEIANN